jgi:hypothetical protein
MDQSTLLSSANAVASNPILTDQTAASLVMLLIEKPQALAPVLAVFLIFVLIRGQMEQNRNVSKNTEKISELIEKVSDLTSKLAILADRADRH